jgi:hypothetical protein
MIDRQNRSKVYNQQSRYKEVKVLISLEFPVRKILSKASTMGMFFRKDKVFEF